MPQNVALYTATLISGVITGLWLSDGISKSAAGDKGRQAKQQHSKEPSSQAAAYTTPPQRSLASTTDIPAGKSVIEQMDQLKFGDLSSYYARRERQWRENKIENYAPMRIFDPRTPGDVEAQQVLVNKMLAARDASVYWKGTGSFTEAGHVVDVTIYFKFNPDPQPSPAAVEGAPPAAATDDPHLSAAYFRYYLVDGKQTDYPMHSGSEMSSAVRVRDDHDYYEDGLYYSDTTPLMSSLLIPLPFEEGVAAEYLSSATDEWMAFPDFRWTHSTEEEESAANEAHKFYKTDTTPTGE